MNIDYIRTHCLSKKATTEAFPFDEHTLVFKVLGKMFALAPLERWEAGEASLNLKADPEYSQELRDTYSSIGPGFHMNKLHWNTIYIHKGELKPEFVLELIDHSYDMVIKGMTKKQREILK